MRILLATDGSPFSEVAVNELATRVWPAGTEVKVLDIAHPLPCIPEPTLVGVGVYYESVEEEQVRAKQAVASAEKLLAEKAPNLQVTSEVLEGSPKKLIVEEAERWQADLILVGSHGYGPVRRFLLGSVAQAVALHAPCSVEIVRSRTHLAAANATDDR